MYIVGGAEEWHRQQIEVFHFPLKHLFIYCDRKTERVLCVCVFAIEQFEHWPQFLFRFICYAYLFDISFYEVGGWHIPNRRIQKQERAFLA